MRLLWRHPLPESAMLLSILLFGGGWLYWVGLLSHWRNGRLAGVGALSGALGLLIVQGGIAPAVFPILLFATGLAGSLKCVHHPLWQAVGWSLYLLIVLALGFRLAPGFAPVTIFEILQTGTWHRIGFAPEKLILLLLTPPLVLTPVALQKTGWPGRDWPRLIFALLLVITLAVLVPLALALDFTQPGWMSGSLLLLAYRLADNLLFVCVLEESFFRGIVQTALIRWFAHREWSQPPLLGITAASLLFGVAHIQGGGGFILLATVAGFSYGTVYYLTGRIHYAVALHFIINAVYHLGLAPSPIIQ